MDKRSGSGSHIMMMADDLKKRFLYSFILMLPVLVLSPMIQKFIGVDLRFSGDAYLLFAISTLLFFYGGKPFFTGAAGELKKRSPAMMMLIVLAISTAYVYSSLTVFFIKGEDFFWELATLIVIMLLGHWIEMRSAMGASKALEELGKLMPETAHLILADTETKDVQVSGLMTGDPVMVKPGEKIPIDGIVYDGYSYVNESMITGEAVPVDKQKGDILTGGSVNGNGILMYKVSRVGDQTFISQVSGRHRHPDREHRNLPMSLQNGFSILQCPQGH
jgi:Cu2+-exporting ATPase